MPLTAVRRELDRLIAEIELWTTAQAEAVATLLARGQDDEAEATQHLFEQMDRLTALRLKRTEIECLTAGEPGAAAELRTVA